MTPTAIDSALLTATAVSYVEGDDAAGNALRDQLTDVGFDEVAVNCVLTAYRLVREDPSQRDRFLAESAGKSAPVGCHLIPIVTGCIDQAEINHDSHQRAKNWVATVAIDKAAPGGLAREFWERGSTSWRHVPASLKAGDVLEFAADYYSGSGRKTANRRYVRVVSVDESVIGYVACDKP